MPVQLFRLRNVPDDEAEDVRNLLEKNHINYYETPAGNWGISMPALWLYDESQLDEAKKLIDEYQIQRSKKIHHHSEQQQSIFHNPIRLIVYMMFAGLILYFSIKPFLDFGK